MQATLLCYVAVNQPKLIITNRISYYVMLWVEKYRVKLTDA